MTIDNIYKICRLLLVICSSMFFATNIYAMDYNSHLKNITKNTGLEVHLVEMALKAHKWASNHTKVQKNLLTIVDYSKPSDAKRLTVIDLNNDKPIMNLLVAQGKNTGDRIATHFSNAPRSKASSLGVYVTGTTYSGQHGYSLRLHGLEAGINDNAFSRAVVVHPAAYVNEQMAQKLHRIGRSWGCLAVEQDKAKKLINLIKDGSVIFAYHTLEEHDHNLKNISLT